MSLKNSWQVQRKQRQYEAVQRQQQVRETLEHFQRVRQTKAAELREDLRLFQLELQLDTQDFLSQASLHRQEQAEQLAQQLYDFTQTLREQTAQSLTQKAIDRSVMVQQLVQDLSAFHADLSLSVTSLRQTLRQQSEVLRMKVQAIRETAQQLLKDCQQKRIQNQIEQIQRLESWVETLQADVQQYLTYLSLSRHDRNDQMRTMLAEDCDRRHTEMSELFQQLGQFRAELKNYHTELHQIVWGEATEKEPVPNDLNSLNQKNLQQSINIRPQETTLGLCNKAQNNKPQSSGSQGKKPAKQSSKPSISRTVKRLTSIQNSKNQVSPEPVHRNTVHANATSSTTNSNPISPNTPQNAVLTHSLDDPIEKQVYHHIEQTHGARLTEIETTLNLNRFQAVDALRALIKKGLVTQRDRIYLIQDLIQEEVSL